ncbi:MAG: DASS family sodium-coupled anion symporter [Planctomycetes bacterium]|nr:DASS family sodium-coupled anion symporter [Planctomycetota bacterium]MBI3846718.1 DASS family sodium-coupled anion symporter [Planctomycetota bacterium]
MKRWLTPWRVVGFAAGIAAFLAIALADSPLHHVEGMGRRPAYAAAVTSLMAIWWLTEALPILVTACVPLVLFPLLGVFGDGLGVNVGSTMRPYVDPYIWLFMGGMAIAAAMQQWRLHKRIALSIMKAIGTEPKRLLLGLLVATAFISLWISNTATATMMLPIGLAIIAQLEAQSGGRRLEHYGASLMLAIAYASNVGGIGTKVGTAPNTQFAGFCSQNLGIEVSFLKFVALGLPFVAMFLPIVWWALWRTGRHDAPHSSASVVERELAALGPMRREEKAVLGMFLVTAALWISSQPITAMLRPLGNGIVSDFGSKYVEGTIAIVAALVLLATRLLDRRQLRTVPWLTLILLGGGFSMAAGIEKSGLSSWLGSELRVLRDVPPVAQVAVASFAAVGLSAVCSNSATVAVMLGVLYRAVSRTEVMSALAATTLGASCDFMLPAGTPPNAIVFGSGYLTIRRMAKTGVVLDLLAATLVAIWCSIVTRFLFATPA